MGRDIFWFQFFGNLADRERHTALNVLAAFSRKLELKTRENLLNYVGSSAELSKLSKSVDCL